MYSVRMSEVISASAQYNDSPYARHQWRNVEQNGVDDVSLDAVLYHAEPVGNQPTDTTHNP